MPRIVKTYSNQRVTATIGGQKCYFRSKLEYRWARYLEWLKENGEIKSWRYESKIFNFTNFGYEQGPFMYRPDFEVIEKDGTKVYHECKGYHDGATNRKFQRLLKHYPNVVIDLVRQSIPKGSKGAQRLFVAKKYVRRVIDASIIFRQMKGVIDLEPPKLRDM